MKCILCLNISTRNIYLGVKSDGSYLLNHKSQRDCGELRNTQKPNKPTNTRHKQTYLKVVSDRQLMSFDNLETEKATFF